MGALATLDDLRVRTTLVVTDERGQAALDDASAAVRAYTGQSFDVATTTDRLRMRSGVARLPQRPATAVTAVQAVTGGPLAFFWDGAERVYLQHLGLIPYVNYLVPEAMRELVDVTYTHGYATVPPDVLAVVCNVAARTLGSTPDEGALTGVTLDGYGETYGSVGAAGPVGMFDDERVVLDRYRRVGGQAILR